MGRAVANTEPVTVVTGASSGIGAEAARVLAREQRAKVVLVARREEVLRELAEELGAGASWVAVDLTEDDAPKRVREHLEERHGRLDLLVNNAGAAWRGRFGDVGYDNVRKTMKLNFDSVLRLTEELLPLLRSSAPSAIVNVASTAGRVARAGSGAYSASKFALIGWSEALHLEERPNGVHVGTVMPGFVKTEGFPAEELLSKRATRWIVSEPRVVADAIVDVGIRGKAERYCPRPYGLAAVARVAAPALVRMSMGGSAGAAFTTRTGSE